MRGGINPFNQSRALRLSRGLIQHWSSTSKSRAASLFFSRRANKQHQIPTVHSFARIRAEADNRNRSHLSFSSVSPSAIATHYEARNCCQPDLGPAASHNSDGIPARTEPAPVRSTTNNNVNVLLHIGFISSFVISGFLFE